MLNDKYTQAEIDFYNRVEALIRHKIADLQIMVDGASASSLDATRASLAQSYGDLARCQALRAALVRIAKATVGGVDNPGETVL